MLEEKLDKLKARINNFQINTTLNVKVDNIKIINGNIYVYVINNSIKIYDCKTFKEKAVLKLPFKRKKPSLEIIENEILIIQGGSKLYFYKINIKENKLSFLYYLSEIYNFCYLSKRKEIFLLTELGSYDEDIKPWGMARADLLGNIIFQNKIKPTISYEFVPPKPENTFNFPTHVQSNKKNFAKFNGFNNDKYIINISGYVYDWYDYKINWRETEIRFDVAIFDADNFNELLNEKHYNDLEYSQITNNLFKFTCDKRSFYYNEKNNKIEFIDNIFDYISKSFNFQNLIKDNKQYTKHERSINNNELLYYQNQIKKNNNKEISNSFRYFYLNDNMFAIFDKKFYLYIVDLSTKNNIVKKVKLNLSEEYLNPEIKNIIYSKVGKRECLFISLKAEIEYSNKITNKLIHGIIC